MKLKKPGERDNIPNSYQPIKLLELLLLGRITLPKEKHKVPTLFAVENYIGRVVNGTMSLTDIEDAIKATRVTGALERQRAWENFRL
jgi:phosphatidate phosphatase APP1